MTATDETRRVKPAFSFYSHSPYEAFGGWLYNYFYQLLAVHWIAAITISACGWLLVAVQMARGRSILPRWLVLLTPLPLSLVIGLACGCFPASPLAAMLGGATFNLAQLLFYSAAWRYAARYSANPRRRPV